MINSRNQDRSRAAYVDPNHASETFYYDADSSGVSSTQQFRVDWSDFKNHVFFGSAAANVNVAFDKAINGYPYDGTREQVKTFVSKLTGFERWMLSSMPSWVGHINLSSSYAVVQDSSGMEFSGNASDAETGAPKLSPSTGSLSIEFLLNPASQANQIVATSSGSSCRWTVFISGAASPASCSVGFAVTTQNANMSTACQIPLGTFSSVCCVYDATDTLTRLRIITNGTLAAVSSGSLLSSLDTTGQLLIGSGSAFVAATYGQITPSRTLTGSIDEFRLWRYARDASSVRADMTRNIFAQDGLVLYYRFNEPPPPLISGSASSSIDSILLDSSGNALHGTIVNFLSSCRATASQDSGTIVGERIASSPVLFPEYPDSVSFREALLLSASLYDSQNPNNILRLIPRHFLEEARAYDGASDAGSLHSDYSGGSVPGSSVLGSTQLMVSLLYTMGRFFDELKIGVDQFSGVNDAFYDEPDTVPDSFISDAVSKHGFDSVPALFSDATLSQYVSGDDISSTAQAPARDVRNTLLRRFLSNAPDIIASKGTIHSVEALLRTLGVNPGASVKLKERSSYGSGELESSYTTDSTVAGMIAVQDSVILRSLPLSGSRVETGWPDPQGSMIKKSAFPPHGISSSPSDGLYTSGSWTAGATVCWPSGSLLLSQSLFRLMTTGSSGRACLVNVVATRDVSTDYSGAVTLYASSNITSASAIGSVSISGVSLFDGATKRVEVSYVRPDRATTSRVSSSYSLRVIAGESRMTTQSFFLDDQVSAYRVVTSSYNASGAFIEIGNSPLPVLPAFVNAGPREAIVTSASFYVGHIQFLSKASEMSETIARATNFTSFASTTPATNSGALTAATGSYERLRLDVASMMNQSERIADSSGSLQLLDASIGGRHIYVTGLMSGSDAGRAIVTDRERVSTSYDESVSTQKITIASNASRTRTGLPRDTRFSIELSLVDALSQAMLDMLSSPQALADAIGGVPEQMSPDYPKLDALSDAFFTRLSAKLDFRSYTTAYRWLESLVGSLARQLIPRHAVFGGATFVMEPHAFERGKVEYRGSDRFLSIAPADITRDSLYLQQIVGSVSR